LERGLDPIESVQPHILTERPWLAADPVIGPAGASPFLKITQTGAWLLSDSSALPDDVERFLEGGTPPVYLGFGSMRATEDASRRLIEAVRALGLRSIISRGWGNLKPIDADTDCLAVGDVSHERLFPRVAAIVHHGGAGTTTTAARAGKPQVIVPHLYDQYYWAHRVEKLGIGVSGPQAAELTVEGLVSALRRCLEAETVLRARDITRRIEPHGARIAAGQLVKECE
jgi:vancomycin aglycone glucosyltransferase